MIGLSSEERVPVEPPPAVSVTLEGLNQLLALSPDALLIVDEQGRIVMVNAATLALFGYTREELQGQLLERLLPAHLRERHTAHRQRYTRQPHARPMGEGLSLVGSRRDGSEFAVDISLRPVRLDERLLVIAAVRDTSRQRRLERDQARQAEQNRAQAALLDLAHDAILVRDPLGRVTYWNKGAENLYGWSARGAMGRLTHSLLHTRFPVDLATVEAVLEREGYWEGELIHTCRDGRAVVVESRQALLRDGEGAPRAMMEINRDITARHLIEQATLIAHTHTAERLGLLQEVLDALPSSVYLVYGQQARLLLANRATLRYWGAEWPQDQPMLEFLHAHRIQILDERGASLPGEQYATLRAVQAGETVLQQQEIIRRPGESGLPVVVSALPLDARTDSGPLVASSEAVALVVHQDVRALKQAEALKDEFISVAAHELRNPLSALTGYASMLLYQSGRGRGAKLSKWQREALEEIMQASARLDKLTEDLLDATRLQAGRLVLSRQRTDLLALTRHMVQQAQMSAAGHTFSLETTLASLPVDIDGGRVEQVLANLLGNAVKYSPQGGPIEVRVWEEGEIHEARLAIRDRGMGIPSSEQGRIFGRFVRAENAQASQITGSGLGLYLSRELIERHGGRLWFESTEGEGSTFFLALPLS
ncbi:MAG TPA: PAS domain S-box protein [Ktedonobacteraceae bacterium]|nr:PAS domain S-box protein [Ktedonobacteraceae bacterium]